MAAKTINLTHLGYCLYVAPADQLVSLASEVNAQAKKLGVDPAKFEPLPEPPAGSSVDITSNTRTFVEWAKSVDEKSDLDRCQIGHVLATLLKRFGVNVVVDGSQVRDGEQDSSEPLPVEDKQVSGEQGKADDAGDTANAAAHDAALTGESTPGEATPGQP